MILKLLKDSLEIGFQHDLFGLSATAIKTGICR